MNLKTTMSAVVLLLLTLYGCKKSDDKNNKTPDPGPYTGITTVTFTINGDGFNNQVITINGVKGVRSSGAAYLVNSGLTDMEVSDQKTNGADHDNDLQFAFNGSKTGIFPMNTGTAADDKNFLDLTLTRGIAASVYYSEGTMNGANITITKYGKTGDDIEGTFQGKMLNGLSQQSINITKGSFKIIRLPDLALN